jgi:hypothetical protein
VGFDASIRSVGQSDDRQPSNMEQCKDSTPQSIFDSFTWLFYWISMENPERWNEEYIGRHKTETNTFRRFSAEFIRKVRWKPIKFLIKDHLSGVNLLRTRVQIFPAANFGLATPSLYGHASYNT